MNSFLHSVHTWLLSVWSHHPTTWYGWSNTAYMLTVTIGIVLWMFGRKVGDVFLTVAGLAAVMNAIGAANLGNQFLFWTWVLIAVTMSFRPGFHLYAWLKKRRAAQAAKVVPPRSAS